jgi:hypothetical protein
MKDKNTDKYNKLNKIMEKIFGGGAMQNISAMQNWGSAMQKGGAFTQNEFVQTIMINIFLFVCYNAIFICLFKFNNSYSYIYYLLIGLIILSFFTFVIILIFNPLGKFLTRFFITRDWTGNVNINYINLIASFILSSGHLLQFVSAILIFLVFYSSKPPTNKFSLTTTNANNLFYYEIFYIYAYLSSILFFIIISAIDNNIGNTITINILLGLIGLVFCGIVSYMFYSGYQLYDNVYLKGNQLFQGSPNKIINKKGGGKPKLVRKIDPLPKLPPCTPGPSRGVTRKPTDPRDQCYT